MFKGLQAWLFWRGVKRRVKERGWTIIHLGDGRSGPTWAYSVGLWESTGGPELILFGHDLVWSNGLISQARQQLQEGLQLSDFKPWTLDSFEGVWRRVDPIHIHEAEWFSCARRYKRERTGDESFEAYQLFVPDGGGKYPWEDGFDEAWRHYQAELYLPEAQHGPHAQRLAGSNGV